MTVGRKGTRHSEWCWLLLMATVVLAMTSLPYLVAWSHETPQRRFGGCMLLVEDCYSYLGKMRQGADGAWLFHIPYTPESHPGTLLYPFYLVLGKIANLLPGADLALKLVLVYHLARVVLGAGFLVTVYRFLAALTQDVRTRRLAWLMVAIGGGLGWLLIMLGEVRWLGDMPLDLYFPEGFGFIALFGFPHVAAAQSLMFAGILALLRAWQAPSRAAAPAASAAPPGAVDQVTRGHDRAVPLKPLAWAAVTGIVWLLMGLIVPFYVPVAWAVSGAAWVGLHLRQRPALSGQWREGLMAGVAALISAPVVAYSAWVFTSDPVYAAWGSQNRIVSPHPLHYVAAYGIPLILAAVAAKETWQREGWGWIAVCWVAVVPLLVYLPVNLQLRLTTGVQVPLSLLAAAGAMQLWERDHRKLAIALLSPMIPTALVILASSVAWMMARPSPSFRDAAEVAALDWLAAHAEPQDVVLTAYDTGAYLPARANARVLVGHNLEAMDAEEKNEQVARFYRSGGDDAWRRQLLSGYGVDYVFWGRAERRLGRFDPRARTYLQEVYAAEDHIVFAVER